MKRAVIVLLLATLSSTADAHQTSVKYIDLVVRDDKALDVTVKCQPGDVTEPLGLAADAKPSVADAIAKPAVGEFMQQWFALDGCTATAPKLVAVDASFLAATWTATCARTDEERLDFTRFFSLDRRHEAIVRLAAQGHKTVQTIVRASSPHLVMHPGESPSLLAWIGTGMDHIYSGIDHILFVISLLLVVMLFRPGGHGDEWKLRGFALTLKSTGLVITAFTVAHSISLIAAALGYVALSSRFVESMIALSIAYTAVEDILRPDVRWRFILTFGFGLIHGLGFASTLSNLLPPRDVVVPLLCFNVGVEIGQLSIVAVVLPILYGVARGLRAPAYRRYALPAVAGCIAIAGLVMFAQRVT